MSLANPQPPLENPVTPESDDDIVVESPWLRLARQSYEGSSEWVDANLRYQWERSISLFNSQHPSGSKYHSSAYDKRSKFFRPKTRTAVRNLQSAMSIAFFSNEDVMSVSARNPNDSAQAAAAIVSQSIMQYRLTNTIPWFNTMVSAIQDAAVQGVCVSHQYWDFEQKEESYLEMDENSQPLQDSEGNDRVVKQLTSVKDTPKIELISPEKFKD